MDGTTSPVFIAGAGPTGMAAALMLARAGIQVRLVDKLAEPRTTSRALAVHARTLEVLEPLGLTAKMVALGLPAEGATLFSDGEHLADIDITRIESRYNYILMLSQAETERLMREELASLGVTVDRPVELIALAQVESHTGGRAITSARAVLKHADGSLEECDTAYLLATEGAHSLARHTLNLPFEGSALEQRFALADLHIDGPVAQNRLSMFLSKTGFTGLFPLEEGHFRVISTEDAATHGAGEEGPTVEQMQHLFDRDTGLQARLHDSVWSSWFGINTRMVSSLHAGAVFLGGDSAHVHSPAGGQGMNTGIQDMVNLGWKLAMVLRGQASAKLLDTYNEERLPVIRQVLRVTEGMTETIATEGALGHQLINLFVPMLLGTEFMQRRGTNQLSQLVFHYRDSSFSRTQVPPGSLRAGDRLPELYVSAQTSNGQSSEKRLLELVNPTRLVLLTTGKGAALPAPEQLAPWSEILEVVRLSPSTSGAELARFESCFGPGAGLFLARPDAYLGYVGGPHSGRGLLLWLQQWFTRAN